MQKLNSKLKSWVAVCGWPWKKKFLWASNSSGFVALALIGTLPILLILTLSMQLHGQIFRERILQNICRDRLLELQQLNALGIEALLSLNLPIRTLKTQLRVLEALRLQAVLTSNPVVAAALSVKIQILIGKLKALQFRQQQIIVQGRMKASYSLNLLQQELRHKAELMRRRTEVGHFNANLTVPSQHLWALDLIEPPFPEYRLKAEFEKAQAISVHWKWRSKQFRKELICGATLLKTAQNLQPKIHEVRF